MFRSIRHGLFAALAGFTVLLCLCYTALLLVVSYVTEDMLVDRLLEREAAALTAHHARHGTLRAPGLDLVRLHASPATLPAPVRAEVAAGRERGEIFVAGGAHYHLRTVRLAPAAQPVWLLADVGPILVVSRLFEEVGGVLLLVALGLVALALGLAWWLARRLVAPLQLLAREVRTLPAQDRFDFAARTRRDEIGYLADKLGTAMAAVHAALARERAFTRDVSHELRTPLTVLKNALASAPQVAAAPLRAQVDDIAATIDVLFALARTEALPAAAFDLRACVEDVLLRQPGVAEWDEARLVLDLPERLAVTGNRQLAMLLLDNCIGNALFHGGPGCRLTVSFADGVLAIVNTVEAHRPGTVRGFLHGHNLLQRLAAAMGWSVRFEPGAASYRVAIAPR